MSETRGSPAGWSVARLEDLFDTITDGDHQAPPQVEQGVPFLVIGNVRTSRLDFADVRFVPKSYYESLAEHRKPARGDLLYTVTGSLGIPALVDTDRPFCVQRHIAMLKPARETNVRYLFHALSSTAAFQQATKAATGTAQKTLGLASLRAISVHVAPAEEQVRVVDAIDSLLSRLDAAVANLESAQKKLKAYRASVLKEAVEGRLVPTEATLARAEKRDFEPADALLKRILAERRRRWEEAELAKMRAAGKSPKDDKWKAKYQEPDPPDTNDLPALPEGWCWATMDALIADGPQNGLYVPQARYGQGCPILRIDDFQTDWSRASHELQRVAITDADAEKYALREGDVVVNRVNSMTHLGKALAVEERHVPATFESNMMRFSPARGVEPRYVWVYLSSSSGKARLTKNAKWAVNQASINQKDVGACAVPLPPNGEQRRILAEVDRLLTAAEASTAGVRQNVLRCNRLRQAVLKWAFEGKLVDQDPNDEPAAKLIERIRAERAGAETPKRNRRARNGQ